MKRILLLLVMAALWSAPTCLGQFTIYLQTDPEIAGDVTTKGFVKAWDLSSFSHGLVNKPVETGSGAQGGTPEFEDFAVGKFLDSASVNALFNAASGGHLNLVTLSFVNTNAQVIYKVLMEDVLITSITQTGPKGVVLPTEQVKFYFRKITWTFNPYDTNGKALAPIVKSYDRKT